MNIKKITIIFSLFLFLFVTAFSTSVGAQAETEQWWNPSFQNFKDKVSEDPARGGSPANEIFGERYTVAQVNWIVNSLAMLPLGSLVDCLKGSAEDIDICVERALNNRQSGTMLRSPLLFLASTTDGLMSTRPASGVEYVASVIDKYSPVKTSYAQEGFGFGTLQPLRVIWRSFRDIAFGLMAFATIVLAFMIILRQKISAQATVTVQSALPKIAVGLIFITFSYAIAGFLIDLSFVVLGVISAVISGSGLVSSSNVIANFNTINNPVFGGMAGWMAVLTIILGAVAGIGLAATIGSFGIAGIAGAISGLLAVVLVVLFAIAAFRIFTTMLRAFASIVFLVIGSPFIGILSVLNMGPGIGGWAKQMIAQLSVFVGVCVAVMLSHLIFWSMSSGIITGVANVATLGTANPYQFIPSQIGTGGLQFPGFTGIDIGVIAFFVGFGLLFSAPKIATGLRDQILTGRGSYGFDTFGTIAGPVAWLASQGKNTTENIAKGQINEYANVLWASFRAGRKGSKEQGLGTSDPNASITKNRTLDSDNSPIASGPKK